MIFFYEVLHLTSPKIAVCPISKVLACQKPEECAECAGAHYFDVATSEKDKVK